MNRRTFLKAACAVAGTGAVPALSFKFQANNEPVKWLIEEEDYSFSLAIGAEWRQGTSTIRHAIAVAMPNTKYDLAKVIESCKQALRQWYAENKTRLGHA